MANPRRRSSTLLVPMGLKSIRQLIAVRTTAREWTSRTAPSLKAWVPASKQLCGRILSSIPDNALFIMFGYWKTRLVAGRPGMPSGQARHPGPICRPLFRNAHGHRQSGSQAIVESVYQLTNPDRPSHAIVSGSHKRMALALRASMSFVDLPSQSRRTVALCSPRCDAGPLTPLLASENR